MPALPSSFTRIFCSRFFRYKSCLTMAAAALLVLTTEGDQKPGVAESEVVMVDDER